MRASHAAAEIQTIAQVAAVDPLLTPAMIDSIHQLPQAARSAIVELAIHLSDVSIAP
jgi:hypothetical protein